MGIALTSGTPCKICGLPIRSDNKTGICTRRGACKRAWQELHDRRQEHAAYRHRYRRQLWADFHARINAIKLAAGCVDCGYNASPVALDFDHLPGHIKLFGVSSGPWRPWSEIEREMAKCEVVCANCHRIRTAARMGARPKYEMPAPQLKLFEAS